MVVRNKNTNSSRHSDVLERHANLTSEIIEERGRPIFAVTELAKAFKYARTAPQARKPPIGYGRAKRSTVPSMNAKFLDDKTYSHFLMVEGRLEQAFARKADLESDYDIVLAQPFFVHFPEDEYLGTYIFDFSVYPENAPPFAVDVKNSPALTSPKYSPLAQARKDAFAKAGFDLFYITEKELCKEPRSTNIRKLHGYLRHGQEQLEQAAKAVRAAVLANGGQAALHQINHLPVRVIQQGTAYGLFSGQLSTTHQFPYGAYFTISAGETS